MQKINNGHTKRLNDAGLSLWRGWNEAIANQLTILSREDEIIAFTPHDAAERFVTVDSANIWYEKKEHIVYTLQNDDGQIGGLLWFSLEPKDGIDYTIGIRMYAQLRGRGLAGAMMDACHADLHTLKPSVRQVWLVTDEANARARALYLKHGYREISTSKARTLMVYSF